MENDHIAVNAEKPSFLSSSTIDLITTYHLGETCLENYTMLSADLINDINKGFHVIDLEQDDILLKFKGGWNLPEFYQGFEFPELMQKQLEIGIPLSDFQHDKLSKMNSHIIEERRRLEQQEAHRKRIEQIKSERQQLREQILQRQIERNKVLSTYDDEKDLSQSVNFVVTLKPIDTKSYDELLNHHLKRL